MPGPDITIRPYRTTDRDAVRHICVETGFMGDPVQWQWRDEASFADLFSGWYTDHAADSASVAEQDGRVVGYLLGCADTSRVPNPIRVLVPTALRRGLLLRPGTAGFLWRGIGDSLADLRHGRAAVAPVQDDRWPADLHVDLLPRARGVGVGGRLVTAWLDRLRDEGVPGCHLETMAENQDAIGCFERLGFHRTGVPNATVGMRARDGSRLHVQLMVQEW